MNRGVLQNNSPVVQQMMAAGNPSLWNINNLMRPPFISSSSSSSSPSSSSSTLTHFLAPLPNNNYNNHNNNNINNNNNNNHINTNNNIFQANPNNNNTIMNMSTSSSSWLDDDHHHHPPPFPESWSQLLLGGVFLGEGEEQVLLQQQQHHHSLVDHVKQESSVNSYSNNVYAQDQEFQLAAAKAANLNWSPQINNIIPTSSPQSCVTTTFSNNNNNNNMLDFSSKCSSDNTLHPRHTTNPLPLPDHSSECNSTSTGGAMKKAKVQPSSSPSPTFKVRKEKLGDRITALHQLVSPFGKTDTASVLLEAIGYIRFLQSQIQALSLPYLTSGTGTKRQPHSVQGERKCIFPEDPGQLLNEKCLKRKGGPDDQESIEEAKNDLRSRGLCLVPLSCTMHVGSDNGADYWAPTTIGGGFR